VPSFTHSKDMIGAKTFKTGHATQTTPLRGYFVIHWLTLDMFYLHAKFGDSRFSRSGNMIAGVKIENVSSDRPSGVTLV